MMGAEATILPFRLAGWTYNIRFVLIPALLLLTVWTADMANMRKYFVLGIMMLILHGFSDALLRSSRGAILMQIMYLVVLFFAAARLTKMRIILFSIASSVVIILYPAISFYRQLRNTELSSTILSNFYASLLYAFSSGTKSFSETLYDAVTSIFFRFTGADSLSQIIGGIARPLYTDAIGIDVTRYFTVDILDFPMEAIHGSATSFLGWFYIVGGNIMVVVGVLLFTIGTFIIWEWLPRYASHCLPVAQSIFIVWLIGHLTEGNLDSLLLSITVLAGSIVACEMLARWVDRGSTTHHQP